MQSYAMHDFFQVKLVLADVKIFPQSIQSSAVQERAGLFIIHTTSFCFPRNIRSLFNPQKSSKVKKTYGNLLRVISKFTKLIMQNYGRALALFASIRMITSGCYNNRVCLGCKLHSKLPQKQTKSFVSFS